MRLGCYLVTKSLSSRESFQHDGKIVLDKKVIKTIEAAKLAYLCVISIEILLPLSLTAGA